ncbi:MAG: hypothetical protein C0483_21910 [Pirellula sp.]|nr:hypothetical protein [Pirellula sp.]
MRIASHSIVVGFALLAAFAASSSAIAQDASAPQAPAAVNPEAFRVPDGSPAELLEFIQKVRKLPPAGRDLPEVVEHLQKVHGAVIEAVDKLGAAGTEQEQIRAVSAKLEALQMLRRIEVAGADKQMRDYLAALAADKRSYIPPLAKVYHLATRLGEIDRGDHASLEKFFDEVREHVKTAKLDGRNLNIAFQTAALLERAGMTKQALEAYVEFAAAFAASDDPAVVENARMLEGAARYLSLPGKPMEVQGKTVDGQEFDLKKLAGKVVLVDFWATWCGPCIAELPTLRDCYTKYHDRGFEVVGISLDDDRSRLTTFLTREELPWTTLFSDDEKATGWKHPLAARYGVMSIPRGVLIDRKGNVVSLDAHGDALWDLLAKEIGPPEVKEAEEGKPAGDVKPAEKQPAAEPKAPASVTQ